jgi:hypothetical protein
VGVGTDLRNAASNFFSQSGATNDALTRIFRPSRMVRWPALRCATNPAPAACVC